MIGCFHLPCTSLYHSPDFPIDRKRKPGTRSVTRESEGRRRSVEEASRTATKKDFFRIDVVRASERARFVWTVVQCTEPGRLPLGRRSRRYLDDLEYDSMVTGHLSCMSWLLMVVVPLAVNDVWRV